MANQLHIYTNNPMAGGVDGTETSSGTGLSPITVTLDASKEEVQAVKCALRCDTGFKIEGETAVSITGTNAAKWKLAKDAAFADATAALQSAAWADTLSLADVAAVNVVFWVKAISTKDEMPQKDTSVSLQAVGKVVTA